MAVIIDGTTGITTPAETVSGASTVGSIQAGGIATNLYPLVSGTAQASTSGTSIDFTGIPSWAKRVTIMLNNVSTAGAGIPTIQIGSGSVETTGYVSTVMQSTSGSGSINSSLTTGVILNGAGASAYTLTGQVIFTLMGSNLWVASFSLGGSGNFATLGGASKTTAGALDRIRLTTHTGTDTFDAGSINILYE